MKIDIDIPDSTYGEWKIISYTVTQKEADLNNLRCTFNFSDRFVEPGTYKVLKRNDITVMSNTPAEIRDLYSVLFNAKGHILINGLGLGCIIKGLYEGPNKNLIKSVTVIEISPDLINLISPYYKYPNLNIICADAFDWKPPKNMRYNYIWHDIWDDICSANLIEMKKLHRKYSRKCEYQASWCRRECVRSKK